MKLIKQTLRAMGILSMLSIGFQSVLADGNHHVDKNEYGALGEPGMAKDVVRTVEVTMGNDMRFVPDVMSVKAGETIHIHMTNNGSTDHEFVLNTADEIAEHAELMRKFPQMEHGAEPNAVRLKAGESGDIFWKFTRAGNFVFACLIPGHLEAGMRGVVIVTSSDNVTTQQSSSTSSNELSSGEIRKIDIGQKKMTIRHGELKNLGMPGMTMIFQVSNAEWLKQFQEGDSIEFRAEKKHNALVITQMKKID